MSAPDHDTASKPRPFYPFASPFQTSAMFVLKRGPNDEEVVVDVSLGEPVEYPARKEKVSAASEVDQLRWWVPAV